MSSIRIIVKLFINYAVHQVFFLGKAKVVGRACTHPSEACDIELMHLHAACCTSNFCQDISIIRDRRFEARIRRVIFCPLKEWWSKGWDNILRDRSFRNQKSLCNLTIDVRDHPYSIFRGTDELIYILWTRPKLFFKRAGQVSCLIFKVKRNPQMFFVSNLTVSHHFCGFLRSHIY